MYTIKIFTAHKRKRDNKNGVYEFTVNTMEQADSHAKIILRCGYRRQIAPDTVEWISPHQIRSIQITGPDATKGYNDTDITV